MWKKKIEKCKTTCTPVPSLGAGSGRRGRLGRRWWTPPSQPSKICRPVGWLVEALWPVADDDDSNRYDSWRSYSARRRLQWPEVFAGGGGDAQMLCLEKVRKLAPKTPISKVPVQRSLAKHPDKHPVDSRLAALRGPNSSRYSILHQYHWLIAPLHRLYPCNHCTTETGLVVVVLLLLSHLL